MSLPVFQWAADDSNADAVANTFTLPTGQFHLEYDARVWLRSAEGRAAGRPPKEESIYTSKRLLDFVTITCANRCVGWPKSGELKQRTK